MKNSDSILRSTVSVGHTLWSNLVHPGDIVVDATCGNGHDTLFLAHLALQDGKGTVIAIDIQPQAIRTTKKLLQEQLDTAKQQYIEVHENCHSSITTLLASRKAALIVYNLGYLPGSDKIIKTMPQTTLAALAASLECLQDEGVVSITCYPGHTEGAEEEKALISFTEKLDQKQWRCLFFRFTNRREAPSLILIQKIK